jgi:hypothetical protein
MNTSLLKVVKQIAAQNGEDVLGDHKRLAAFFGDLAKDEPKPQRMAFCKCAENGFYGILKTIKTPEERREAVDSFARRLQNDEGLDLALCADALELFAAAVYGDGALAPAAAPPAAGGTPAPSGKAAKAEQPQNRKNKTPEVYVAGKDKNYKAAYWKNGQITILADGYEAASIFVFGSDVYVAGDGGGGSAAYWKNGQKTILTDFGLAKSIFVSGSDVYVAGWYGEKDSAVYWNNGQVIILDDGHWGNSIFVSGSDVYIAGQDKNYNPAYWKNGKKTVLYDNGKDDCYSGDARSIFVSGSDVYAAGRGEQGAGYWKNGKNIILADCLVAESIFISGSDVYVAGRRRDGSAAYWKNGQKIILSNKGNSAESIFVCGSDVYVAGLEFGKPNTAAYWKNGQKTILDGKDAHSIFISHHSE